MTGEHLQSLPPPPPLADGPYVILYVKVGVGAFLELSDVAVSEAGNASCHGEISTRDNMNPICRNIHTFMFFISITSFIGLCHMGVS